MTDKMMDRVSKVLRQAEDARDRGATAEYETYMEKANTLAQAHSIDLALARHHFAKKEQVQVPERRSHKVAESYIKGRKNAQARHFVELFLRIADVYDLKCLISGNNAYVHAHGFPEDHDMAERLFSILSVQMVQEADRGIKEGRNGSIKHVLKRKREPIPEAERAWGQDDGHGSWYDEEDGVISYMRETATRNQNLWTEDFKENPPPRFRNVTVYDDYGQPVYDKKWTSDTDGRVWRLDFYNGFIAKIGNRLAEEKKRALKAAGIDVDDDTSEKGLVMIEKAKQVEDEHTKYVLDNYVDEKTGKSTLGSFEGAKATRDYRAHLEGQERAAVAVTGAEMDLREGSR